MYSSLVIWDIGEMRGWNLGLSLSNYQNRTELSGLGKGYLVPPRDAGRAEQWASHLQNEIYCATLTHSEEWWLLTQKEPCATLYEKKDYRRIGIRF